MKVTYSALLSLFTLANLALAHGGHGDSNNPLDDDERTPAGDYVVIVQDDDPRSIPELIKDLGAEDDDIKAIYNNSIFKGFAGTMSKHCEKQLGVKKWVKQYEKDIEVRIAAAQTQTDATWGLSRISRRDAVGANQNPLDLNFEYTFDNDPAGAGVNIYVVDTGVNVNHVDFNGRATFGFAFDGVEADGNGHGTHCAGTAASSTLGVAKNANIIAVKVLGADGSGNNRDIMRGIEFVVQDHEQKSQQQGFRGSVISMSLGSVVRSQILDDVLARASQAGVHISVAAGNENQDACNSSPAFASSLQDAAVISVGAINIADQRASFSNVGRCVTTYAPGEDVVSTFIDPVDPANGANNIINNLSGTSMACPHVSGLLAYYLGANPDLATDPARLKQIIIENSVAVPELADDPQAVELDQLGQVIVGRDGQPIRNTVQGDPKIVATNLGVQIQARRRRSPLIRGASWRK